MHLAFGPDFFWSKVIFEYKKLISTFSSAEKQQLMCGNIWVVNLLWSWVVILTGGDCRVDIISSQ